MARTPVPVRPIADHNMTLPGFPTIEAAQTFNSVVDTVARRSGRSRYEVITLLSYAVEAAVDEVSRGNILRVPGLGVVAAWKDERPCVVGKYGRPVMRPVFSPARSFRSQMALCAPISAKGKNAIQRHRRNHTSRTASGLCSSRVSESADAIRRSIRKQLGGSDPLERGG